MYERTKINLNQSTSIAEVGFHFESDHFEFDGYGTLRIKFTSGGIYDYREISYELYKEFLRAVSMGKYYTHNIKGKYSSVRISYFNDFPFDDIKVKSIEEYKTEKVKKAKYPTITGDYLVLIEKEDMVVTEDEIFGILNKYKDSSIKVFRIGEKIIDW